MNRQWKDGMEQKVLIVKMEKTKVMNCKGKTGVGRESAGKVLEETRYVAQNARSGFKKV